MILHLCVNEARNVPLVAAQHFSQFIFRKIGLEVFDRLSRKIVEQFGVVVIGNIIEIHQATDDVIFRACLLDAALAHRDHINLAGSQMLRPQFVRYRRIL